jgi:hypothetical protein
MPLNERELDKLIGKIRDNYSEYSQKFNSKWFNIEAFESRLRHAIINKMNMESFLLAEVANIEKIKEKYEATQKKTAIRQTFSEKVDEILEDINDLIKKYPEKKFHEKANSELMKFYGAINFFALNYFSVLWALIKDRNLKDKLMVLESKFFHNALNSSDKESKRIEDHIMILNRRDVQEIDIEKDKNDILKDTAFLLHEIINFCDMAVKTRDDFLDLPVNSDKIFTAESQKKEVGEQFVNLTGYGSLLKIKEQAENIINDFRLGAFKKK